jgi:hypothetical protein
MNFFKTLALVLAATVLTSQTAFGWGDVGHETTAEIAEILLKSDPATLQQLQNILGVEPMPLAATWPDKVRGDSRFAPVYATKTETPEEKEKREKDNEKKFDLYHFYTVFRDPAKKNIKDALVVLKRFPAILTSNKATREAKMIALRYIIHVAGDVHQPLHIGNEFDRGGNVCLVNVKPKDPTEEKSYYPNLHSTWDDTVVDEVMETIKKTLNKPSQYQVYKWMATSLIAKHQDLVNSVQNLDPETWAQESNTFLTTGEVYPDTLDNQNRPYCNSDRSKIDKSKIPVLDEAYFKNAEALAEKRLVLGGVRLAALLKQTFAKSRKAGPSEDSILTELDKRNGDKTEPLPKQLEFDFGGHQ